MNIEHGHIKFLDTPELQGRGTIDGRAHLMAGPLEAGDRHLTIHFIILGDENSQVAAGRRCLRCRWLVFRAGLVVPEFGPEGGER